MNGRTNWDFQLTPTVVTIFTVSEESWSLLESNSSTTSQLRMEHLMDQKSHSFIWNVYSEYISHNNFILNNYSYRLFNEVLALLSGKKNFGSFSQSADERHFLATVPQLQSIHPENQIMQKMGITQRGNQINFTLLQYCFSPFWCIPTALPAGLWLAPGASWLVLGAHRGPAVGRNILRGVMRAGAAVSLFPASTHLPWTPLGQHCGGQKWSSQCCITQKGGIYDIGILLHQQ